MIVKGKMAYKLKSILKKSEYFDLKNSRNNDSKTGNFLPWKIIDQPVKILAA